ncbi:MAG: hypothetical protein H0U56_15485 [Methylibium sp.]|uniref:hypothetical protein n=1 Tax=Methylibium sp. TaxID=2067992 RepID=UPI0018370408|nr:hypothetical protein [Methylibium sp.]MBA2724255.1 hypothetical protein [Methylibium sp.]MBA3589926.1 hypothetical protein [Methylibium sp.]
MKFDRRNRSDRTALSELNHHLVTTVGVSPEEAAPSELMRAVAHEARQQLAERWVHTQAAERAAKVRVSTTCRWSSSSAAVSATRWMRSSTLYVSIWPKWTSPARPL